MASPELSARCTAEDLGNSALAPGRKILRQGFEIEEALLGNFGIGGRYLPPTPGFDDEENDMVAREFIEVRIYSKQSRNAEEFDPSFFQQLSSKCILSRLTMLDATAREMPTAAISMPDEMNSLIAIDDNGLRPQGDPVSPASDDAAFAVFMRLRRWHWLHQQCWGN